MAPDPQVKSDYAEARRRHVDQVLVHCKIRYMMTTYQLQSARQAAEASFDLHHGTGPFAKETPKKGKPNARKVQAGAARRAEGR